jgi:DNA repair exonuclease SbcCD nuclease subunit
MDDDIIRIIISTDNHLGFAYKDPIRCDDCFASFEEVLIAAREVKIPFIFLSHYLNARNLQILSY